MSHSPMISSPLKQTIEIDWITPLKSYIRSTYGDDPERYSEECASLNRLRQDMRGAGKDSAAGRDLLYRYYGQLELLDLRFPVDENHIKVSFTWFDAFTQKPTSQHSLAYEKASIIFNIASVLSCYAALQNRHEEGGLKTAYHSFQASAGMYTYINENFLHAPSLDLNHDTIKTLINIMLAQAQEVFMEKQIKDGKKPALLAKLASQAAYLYAQAVEGVQENVAKDVFDKIWLSLTQVKASYTATLAQYYQALADDETKAHGISIARLLLAERQAKETSRLANSFPRSPPASSQLGSDTGSTLIEMLKRHSALVEEKISEYKKDNDFIYHQPIPSEASLSAVPKLPAAKAISVSELYQGQDIHKIIGPDIFQKIVPMSVTESASLYDEEKAKMVRAEAERAETANVEMTACLDYLKLPASLNLLKDGAEEDLHVDEEFRNWCHELAGHAPFTKIFSELGSDRQRLSEALDQMIKQLDMEESVCEKMRSKYGADWTQVPSSRLSSTLKGDIRTQRNAIDEASAIDAQLQNNLRQYETDFDEMRSAGELDEADVLYQRALIKAGGARNKEKNAASLLDMGSSEGNLIDEEFEDGSTSVADQIAMIEELMRKLTLIKRERAQVLKDLKEKVHNDDISQVLILNKKSITNQEHQLFKAELEKFRPYQTRLLQAAHKQSSVTKELTRQWSELLRDKRVKAEHAKHESSSRQRGSVVAKYKRVHQAFNDLVTGLSRAQGFYSHMKSTVESLSENVASFVANRKSEGGELLQRIENARAAGHGRQAGDEQARLKTLMERMSVNDTNIQTRGPPSRPLPTQQVPSYPQPYQPAPSPNFGNNHYGQPMHLQQAPQSYVPQHPPHPGSPYQGLPSLPHGQQPYNPANYALKSPVTPSPYPPPPPMQSNGFASPPPQGYPPNGNGYIPPSPYSGFPPAFPPGQQHAMQNGQAHSNGHAQNQSQQPQHQQPPRQVSGDPWAGLNGW